MRSSASQQSVDKEERRIRRERSGSRVDHKHLYRLVELDLLFQVLLHDPVVVVDTVVMEVVHLSCGQKGGEGGAT